MRLPPLCAVLLALAACGSPPPAAPRAAPTTPSTAMPAPKAPTAAVTATPFPHEESDLAPDPAVRWGKLPNGARYALMRSAQPPGKLSVRLHMASGSLLEDDDQQGLAHLLEHMAFNGTKHFAPGELIPRLQSAGIGFGSHSNAHTSYDETVYQVDLPDVRPETIDLGLTIMADQAGGLLLTPEEVSRERRVVLSELRDRDGPGMRLQRRALAVTYAGTKIPVRMPIGLAEKITGATPEILRRYFEAWYRPERMVLAVVGDADLDVLEARVRSVLGAAAATGPVRPDPGIGALQPGEACAALSDPEAEDTSVRIGRVRTHPLEADSEAHRREQFLRDLGESVLARRLRKLTESDPNCPLVGGGGYSHQWLSFYMAGAAGSAKPGRALDALRLITTEYRRMAEHGPTAAELAVEAAAMRSGFDQAVAQAAARTNAGLANGLYNAVSDRQVFRSPVQNRELGLRFLSTADPQAVRSAFRAGWDDGPGRTVVMVVGKDDLGADGDRLVAEAFHTAWSAPVSAPVEKTAAAWGYAISAQAAPVTLGAIDAPWHIGSAEGLSWAVKRTDFQPGQVLIRLRLQTRTGPRPIGVAELAGHMFSDGGLGKHTASEISEVLAGCSAHFAGLAIGDDAVSLTAACQEKDLQRTLEMLRAWLTDAAWRPDAEARAKTAWMQQLEAEPTDLDAALSRRYAELTHPADAWRRPAAAADLPAITADAARTWLSPLFAQAPLTVTIVGDCQPAAAAGLAIAILGGQRPAVVTTPTPEAARAALPEEPTFPAGEYRLQVGGAVAKSSVLFSWPTADIYDIHRTRRLSLLAGCFRERIREVVRQQFGDAYSPYAWSAVGEEWRNQGVMQAMASVVPARAEAVRDLILKITSELGTSISASTLDQVRQPILRSIADQRRQNGWWLGLLSRAHEQPFRLEWQAGIEADLNAATTEELTALAKQYLVPERALVLIGTCPGK